MQPWTSEEAIKPLSEIKIWLTIIIFYFFCNQHWSLLKCCSTFIISFEYLIYVVVEMSDGKKNYSAKMHINIWIAAKCLFNLLLLLAKWIWFWNGIFSKQFSIFSAHCAGKICQIANTFDYHFCFFFILPLQLLSLLAETLQFQHTITKFMIP